MRASKDTPYSDLFQMIGRKIMLKADKNINTLGLNAQQSRMIGYIYEHQDEGLIQKDLADVFQRRGASISSMLQGLEKKGYIERKIPADNERQKNIYVLPKGAELIEAFGYIFEEIENEIVKSLTEEEKKILKDLMVKVNRSL